MIKNNYHYLLRNEERRPKKIFYRFNTNLVVGIYLVCRHSLYECNCFCFVKEIIELSFIVIIMKDLSNAHVCSQGNY